jgi:hypothetical protein
MLVIAGRYGSIGTDDNGCKVGFTEMEFDYALKTGKPIITLINNKIGLLPSSKTERNLAGQRRLSAFIEKARNGRLIKYWNNKDNLKTAVVTSLNSVKEETPGVGWVKADDITFSNINDHLIFPYRGRQDKYKA